MSLHFARVELPKRPGTANAPALPVIKATKVTTGLPIALESIPVEEQERDYSKRSRVQKRRE